MRTGSRIVAVLLATGIVPISTAEASAPLGVRLGGTLPFDDGSLLGLVAACVVAGVWLARKKMG